MKKIIVVDDDVTFSLMLKRFLEKNRFLVTTAKDAINALHILKNEKFDLMLCDYKMPYKDGIEFIEELNLANFQTPIIFMTSFGDIKLAVKSIKMGALDFLTKPINSDDLLLAVKNILKDKTKTKTSTGKNLEIVSGVSDKWSIIDKNIQLVSPTDYSIIIYGETGVGKEIIAYKIHQSSKRKDKPFVAVDCGTLSNELASSELFGHVKGAFTGAISDKLGLLEAANEGTIFLDEIGNLPYDVQVKLLRALQERTIKKLGSNKDILLDIRIIAASNADLVQMVTNGDFRMDLYHRLNEFKIEIAPLRERKDDISVFAKFFLEQACIELNKEILGFDSETELLLNAYNWPGNIRELKNVIRRTALLTPNAEFVNKSTLPSEILHFDIQKNESTALKQISQEMEKQHIISVLKECKYNKSKASIILNIDRKTLYSKIKLYNINW